MEKRKNKGIFVFILVILVLLVLIVLNVNRFLILEQREIYSSFIVGNHIGFDLNKTALTFGMVIPGQSGDRGLIIENTFNSKVKVSINAKGEISKHLIVSENDFYLGPGETKRIGFSVYPAEDAEFGEYEGVIQIYFKRF